eukprot:218204-Ditylum_brightwellii.AAC.1
MIDPRHAHGFLVATCIVYPGLMSGQGLLCDPAHILFILVCKYCGLYSTDSVKAVGVASEESHQ